MLFSPMLGRTKHYLLHSKDAMIGGWMIISTHKK